MHKSNIKLKGERKWKGGKVGKVDANSGMGEKGSTVSVIQSLHRYGILGKKKRKSEK